MTYRPCFYIIALIGCMLHIGCSNDKQPAQPIALPAKPAVMSPFRYHEMIEVSPGQDYDVLSWGRGTKTGGAFEILHSDSAAGKYTTTTGDLEGEIVDAYNSDMDMDGNPEILIRAKGKDTINYTNIYAFEFNNNTAHKLDFPKLTRSQRAGYRGDDNFYIKDGRLFREFPIYDGNNKAAKPTGQKRQFEYGLRGNEFTVKQLSKDSTKASSEPQPVVKEPVKNKKSEKKSQESHKKKKKKHHHRN